MHEGEERRSARPRTPTRPAGRHGPGRPPLVRTRASASPHAPVVRACAPWGARPQVNGHSSVFKAPTKRTKGPPDDPMFDDAKGHGGSSSKGGKGKLGKGKGGKESGSGKSTVHV